MKPEANNMIYRYLGKTGITVSVLGFGNWVNSDQPDPKVEELTYQCMKKCFENGINYFDTAEVYGYGNAEIAMGKALKKAGWARKDFVISTKIFRSGPGLNEGMLSRKHIIEGLRDSLKKLQLDYVDIIFAHVPDPYTPMEESVRAFNWCIEHNLALYWGTSNWNPQQIMEANEVCEKLNLIKPVVEQPEYNILIRKHIEKSLVPLFDKYGLGTTIWSPLCGGLLTGKYLKDSKLQGTRFTGRVDEFVYSLFAPRYYGNSKEEVEKKISKFVEFAQELKCTPAQLALAWCVVNKDVSVTLFGATSVDQVEDNLKAIDLVKKWYMNFEKKIEDIFGNMPTPETNWKTFSPLPPRRPQVLDIKKQITN